jgi:hypothetical protein
MVAPVIFLELEKDDYEVGGLEGFQRGCMREYATVLFECEVLASENFRAPAFFGVSCL